MLSSCRYCSHAAHAPPSAAQGEAEPEEALAACTLSSMLRRRRASPRAAWLGLGSGLGLGLGLGLELGLGRGYGYGYGYG